MALWFVLCLLSASVLLSVKRGYIVNVDHCPPRDVPEKWKQATEEHCTRGGEFHCQVDRTNNIQTFAVCALVSMCGEGTRAVIDLNSQTVYCSPCVLTRHKIALPSTDFHYVDERCHDTSNSGRTVSTSTATRSEKTSAVVVNPTEVTATGGRDKALKPTGQPEETSISPTTSSLDTGNDLNTRACKTVNKYDGANCTGCYVVLAISITVNVALLLFWLDKIFQILQMCKGNKDERRGKTGTTENSKTPSRGDGAEAGETRGDPASKPLMERRKGDIAGPSQNADGTARPKPLSQDSIDSDETSVKT